MIVCEFFNWAQSAGVALRTEGASALARAYLDSRLDADSRREAEIALICLADDPSPRVRRARSSRRLRMISQMLPRPFYRVRPFYRKPS